MTTTIATLTLSATMDGATRIPADDSTLDKAIAMLRVAYKEWTRTRRFGSLGVQIKMEAGVIVGPATVTTAENVK